MNDYAQCKGKCPIHPAAPEKSKYLSVFSGAHLTRFMLQFVAVIAGIFSLHAETHLSGDIRYAILDSTGNPYIVDQDIVVPAGKKLVIKEGCVFLFKDFTGLTVSGQINVFGTGKRPVVFTSIHDADYNPKSDQLPNPFDWNGILINRESNGAIFESIRLRYSVYGIKSQNTNVTITNSVFKQNGQFHFTVNDKIQYVQDNISYSYTGDTNADLSSASSNLRAASKKTPEDKQARSGNNVLVFRYVSLGAGVVGIATGSILLAPYLSAKNELNRPDFIQVYKEDPNAKWYEFQAKKTGFAWGSAGSYLLGGLGLVGFGISFAF